jgi:hypothetical protein
MQTATPSFCADQPPQLPAGRAAKARAMQANTAGQADEAAQHRVEQSRLDQRRRRTMAWRSVAWTIFNWRSSAPISVRS